MSSHLNRSIFLPRLPAFEPESDQLAQYCQVLTQLLISRALPPEMAAVMESLLCELVGYFTDTLKAPRWKGISR